MVLPQVKDAASAASVINHLRNNRIEYIGLIIIGHLLGVSDFVLGKIVGVCMI